MQEAINALPSISSDRLLLVLDVLRQRKDDAQRLFDSGSEKMLWVFCFLPRIDTSAPWFALFLTNCFVCWNRNNDATVIQLRQSIRDRKNDKRNVPAVTTLLDEISTIVTDNTV